MASVTHPRKHSINSDIDHTKERLDMNGPITLLPGDSINFGRGDPYEVNAWIMWDSPNVRFKIGHSVEIMGGLLLGGEATIVGGSLANDSVTIRPSRTVNTPAFTFEGESYASFLLDPNKSEYISIVDTAYNPTTFFRFEHSNDVSLNPHRFEIGHNVGDTTIGLYGYVDSITTHEAYLGDNSSDYMHINGTGGITLYGDARQVRELEKWAYDIYGSSATYNGISCDAATAGVINDFYYAKVFDDGSGWGANPKAVIATFKLPQDYDPSYGSVDIVFEWATASTSGNVQMVVGISPAHNTYDKNDTYQEITLTAPSTAYTRTTTKMTFSGTYMNSIQAGDEIGVVLVRNTDDSKDDMSGDMYVTSLAVHYVANQIGGSL